MAGNRVAVVGVGQTAHRTARKDVSLAGLVREAAVEALEDAGMTWADIDAVVIGKAPDMFEGIAMPELYLADALGAVGKPMMRVHTAGSVGGSTSIVAAKLVAAGHPRAGADRRVREAVRVERDVGTLGRDAVPGSARRGRGRLLRTADPRVHVPVGRAPPHRPPRRREGPARGAAQPQGPPAPPRHRPADGGGVVPALGPAALPRRVPVVGRCDGARARQRKGCGSGAESRGVDPRHGDAQRADDVRRPRPGEPEGRSRLRQGPVRAGRHHQPARRLRLRRDLRALLVVRADVAREPRASARMARAGSSPRPARPRPTATSRGTRRAACCRPTRSARRAWCASARPRNRCGAGPATTRSS